MNDIFAKIPSRNEQGIYKIISDKNLFELLNIPENCQIHYTPTHKLDEDCWFIISEFSTRKFSLDILEEEFIPIDYSHLPRNDFERISFIFSVQGDDFYFQKITPGKSFRKAKFIEMGESARIQEISNSFQINNVPDAVYLKEKDVLMFKSLERISSIFKGIDTLYREATNEETSEFLANPFIVLSESYDAEKVKKLNRKRIALATDKMKDISEEEKNALLNYTAEYCSSLVFDKENMRFEISNEGDLKNLLDGISENFYTTVVSKEKRRSNSNHTID